MAVEPFTIQRKVGEISNLSQYAVDPKVGNIVSAILCVDVNNLSNYWLLCNFTFFCFCFVVSKLRKGDSMITEVKVRARMKSVSLDITTVEGPLLTAAASGSHELIASYI